jgi:PhnB protein
MIVRPERYRHSIVPHIYVDRAADGIAFYKKAFGAEELFRIAHPDGTILHAELSIGGSVFMIGDPDAKLYGDPRSSGRCTASLHIFTADNAALLRRAVDAGAQEIQRPTDMFYGASSASVRDPFGHVWVLLSWKEDLTPGEMERRGNAFLKNADRSESGPRAVPTRSSSARVSWNGRTTFFRYFGRSRITTGPWEEPTAGHHIRRLGKVLFRSGLRRGDRSTLSSR